MIEIKTLENNSKIIDLKINDKITQFIEKHFKEDVTYFEKKNKVKINIIADNEINLSEYIIEFKSKSKKVIEKLEQVESLKKIIIENKPHSKNPKISKKIYKKKKFKKKNYYRKKLD